MGKKEKIGQTLVGVFLCFLFVFSMKVSALTLSGSNNAWKVYNYLKSIGYTKQAAAGVVGNLVFESDGEAIKDIVLDAVEKGSNAGIGMCQWTNTKFSNRRTAFIDYCNARGVGWPNTNLEVQLEFFLKELNGEYGVQWCLGAGYDSKYRMSLASYKQLTDVDFASDTFCAMFERAGMPRLERRRQCAWYFYNHDGGVQPPSSHSTYYPACSSAHTSIVSALQSIGVDSSFSNRSNIAALNGISNYSGTSAQNIQMLNLLKQGKLVKEKTAVQADTTKPIISNIRVSDVSHTGYTVSCTVTDSGGVDRVQFPTWTAYNDQDDIDGNWWTSAASRGSRSGDTYTFRVDGTSHNNECGDYVTHIYAFDSSGNYTSVAVPT
ncbi:MAG: phage tail tip lysozyme, partial [Candidatus Limivivens sp.]|nr:phage tail tip lysozyme [Candidatus Limivivens sp.]